MLILFEIRLNGAGEADGQMIFRVHQGIQKVAHILGIEKTGFRVITNTGEYGQQDVYHIHYHLIGGKQLKWEM